MTDAATLPAPAAEAAIAPLSPAAERMRRHRARRKSGLFCLTLEIRESEVDAFIRCRQLKPEERTSPPAIKKVIYSIVEERVLSRTPIPAPRRPGTGPHGGAA
jgi:hypothetical protein